MASTGELRNVKLVVIGDGAVGKTCLLISYTQKRFPEDYVPTIFDNYVVNLTAGPYQVELSLWDTAGQEEYDRLRPLSYSNANVFLICYSVVNQVSYENISAKWYPEMMHFCPHIPFILVGTQMDLRTDESTIDKLHAQGQRAVTTNEGYILARRIRARTYIECSAKTMENVKQVFDEAVKIVLNEKRRKRIRLRDRVQQCQLL